MDRPTNLDTPENGHSCLPTSDASSSPLSSALSDITMPDTFQSDTPLSPRLSRKRSHTRVQRRQLQEQISRQILRKFVPILKASGLSFKRFLKAWAGPTRLKNPQYRSASQRVAMLLEALGEIPVLEEWRWRVQLVDNLKQELHNLLATRYFGECSLHPTDIETVDFTTAAQDIEQHAPTWYKLMTSLLENERGKRKSYGKHANANDQVIRTMIIITSMVCHSRARNRSNFFPALISTYCHGTGVKRRVIDTFHGFGITFSYKKGNDLVNKIANKAKVL